MFGALGQEHRKQVAEELARDEAIIGGLGALVVIDFDAVESVTASYVKALVLPFLRAGIGFASGETNDVPSALQPMNLFPVVTGLSSEIREEIFEVLKSNRLVLLEGLSIDGDVILQARLLGQPDDSISDTLDALLREGSATASQLCEKNPRQPPVSVNGWNNRLADLYRFRLARREKQGRQWAYTPMAREVAYG